MAAATQRPAPALVDLRQISAARLQTLLDEEIAEWLTRLGWDFRPSAELVQRYVALGSLNGFALSFGGEVVGYTYYVHEERKGLIGDLYLKKAHYRMRHEVDLIRASLDSLFQVYFVERVESQLLLLQAPGRVPLPYPEMLSVHPRYLMVAAVSSSVRLPPHPAAKRALICNWTARYQEDAARVISAAYARHIDSLVNDQYRSLNGARRFLNNIVQYPGCGVFCPQASFVAMEGMTGEMCGVSLASILSPGVGHITQICVLPRMQGMGFGYELLRRSLLALRESGCTRASLTVTAANAGAVRLYDRVGFRRLREFSALVWDRNTAIHGRSPIAGEPKPR